MKLKQEPILKHIELNQVNCNKQKGLEEENKLNYKVGEEYKLKHMNLSKIVMIVDQKIILKLNFQEVQLKKRVNHSF
jgi:hypothetical protein